MKKEQNVEIGRRVRAARARRGLTREELAEQLDLSTLFLSYIECGQKGMSLPTFANLCRVLNVSADELLFGPENAVQRSDAHRLLERMDPEYLPLAAGALALVGQAAETGEKKGRLCSKKIAGEET